MSPPQEFAHPPNMLRFPVPCTRRSLESDTDEVVDEPHTGLAEDAYTPPTSLDRSVPRPKCRRDLRTLSEAQTRPPCLSCAWRCAPRGATASPREESSFPHQAPNTSSSRSPGPSHARTRRNTGKRGALTAAHGQVVDRGGSESKRKGAVVEEGPHPRSPRKDFLLSWDGT